MKMDNRDVYEQLGNLFYAIATDQMIKRLEIGQLKMLISEECLPRNAGSDGSMISEEAHCILVTIDTLQGNNVTSDEAFRDFAKFYAVHQEVFTNGLRDRILETASEIVRVFHEDNGGGGRHFEDLKRLFHVVETVKSE